VQDLAPPQLHAALKYGLIASAAYSDKEDEVRQHRTVYKHMYSQPGCITAAAAAAATAASHVTVTVAAAGSSQHV
jgi:hypothetical protein